MPAESISSGTAGRDAAELLALDCAAMIREVSRAIGRELTTGEKLQLAMLSGAYKAGAGVICSDLVHEPVEVRFPDYLKVLGYPLADKGRQS